MNYQQIQNSLLRLAKWPDLSQLPEADMADVARVCALLHWRPTAGVLVPRILNLDKERAQELLLLLDGQGCFNISASPPAEEAPELGVSFLEAQPVQASLLGKIWDRLAGR